jgi:hypothetical protein
MKTIFLRHQTLVVLLLAIAALTLPMVMLQPTAAQDSKARVQVGVLKYAGNKTSKCFANGFLKTVAENTRIDVHREFVPAVLSEDTVYQFPFLIMSGEGEFKLSDDEKRILKSYLQRGGFILASAGCSSQSWADSFRELMKELFPDQPMAQLPLDHPLMRTIYQLDSLPTRRKEVAGYLEGVAIEGRLVVVFSAMGLNDTENAGGGCCCCGGNELVDAHRLNANLLAYVLTH